MYKECLEKYRQLWKGKVISSYEKDACENSFHIPSPIDINVYCGLPKGHGGDHMFPALAAIKGFRYFIIWEEIEKEGVKPNEEKSFLSRLHQLSKRL